MIQKTLILSIFQLFILSLALSQDNKSGNSDIPENIKFHVQIGDSPTPIERGLYAKIINQPTQSISVLKNNGWYKYLIGEYNNYWEANRLCQSIIESKKIKNAIVVASKNDKYIELEKLSFTNISPRKIYVSGYLHKKGIAYSVQILSTKDNSLTAPKVMRAFNLKVPVYVEKNKDLQCFMVGSVQQIREATTLLKRIKESGLSNAFLVAYLDGIRVPLRAAL